jgi:hypothetical protein
MWLRLRTAPVLSPLYLGHGWYFGVTTTNLTDFTDGFNSSYFLCPFSRHIAVQRSISWKKTPERAVSRSTLVHRPILGQADYLYIPTFSLVFS